MKLIHAPLIMTVFILACNNNTSKDVKHSGPVSDTVPVLREVYPRRKVSNIMQDSSKNNTHDGLDKEGPDGDLNSIFDEYTAQYYHPYIVDSSFKIGNDIFRLHLEHYCLMDSAIVVPKGYVYMYKLDSLVTHNFATRIQLDKNDKPLFKKEIFKKDFDKIISTLLKDYGALLYPNVHLVNGSFEIHYSVSIPLTDVGTAVAAIIDKNGSITYTYNK